ncbi:hypothetical protein RXV86_12395 [Alisedimentitalea sp. MJ-SS2]|uniref:hypothetical protein n=1 Tax=Aliisedimentitalea sp. MJ-SS2 TaxID=3049795 RepID=UPI00290E9D39|nr:hypothetical protein [Alisedimentitalea sp. MJ-SS2]MDU8928188.1 hypothetical protein [Alisedimentitalea sp. MJ-SS2]
MFLELIATIFAGFAGAGIVLLLNKLTGGRLPKWAMPVAAGAAMIATTIGNEYGWFPRTKSNLPEDVVIIDTVENQAWYRPWTYARPYVERFVALDEASVKTHDNAPDHKLADIYLFGRWSPVHQIPVLADCAGSRRAALTDGVSFAADGTVKGADWATVPADDAILANICGGS